MIEGAASPAEFLPLAGRLGLLLAGAAAAIFLVRHLRRDRAEATGALDSLWPRFWVWTAATALLLLTAGLGPLPFALLLAGIAVQAARELAAAGRIGARAAVVAAPVPVLAAAAFGAAGAVAAAAALLLAALARALPSRRPADATALAIPLCVGLPLALLVLLRQAPGGFALIAWILLVVALADVMGMFGGLLFGRRRIAPRLSPGKTLEGVLAGLLGALFGAVLVRFALPTPEPLPYYAAAIALALAGLAGDLLASAIKRHAGIKDFGTVLPGHGGVMDRVDSLLAAAPLGYLLAPLLVP